MSPSLSAAPLLLSLDEIEPSPLNPRRFSKAEFEPEKLRPLGENLRVIGQEEALLVRPMPDKPGIYEIADGERRYRAAKLVGVEQLAVRVRELSDAQMLDVMLSKGTHGQPLSPLAQAHGFAQRMAMEGLSQAGLAAKLGITEQDVSRALLLLELPAIAQEAVERGELGLSVAAVIVSVPDAAEREKFAEEVLRPKLQDGPLSRKAAQALREASFCRWMQGAAFDQKDPRLLPGGGSCTTCPHRSGQLCGRPSCFEAKLAAARVVVVAEFAKRGVVALNAEENARAFPHGENGLSFRSDWVEYQRPVPRELLKAEVTEAPKWTDLCHGPKARVVVHVGFDQAGRAVELVRVAEAVLAADENEREIFNLETLRRYGAEYGREREVARRRVGPAIETRAEAKAGVTTEHTEHTEDEPEERGGAVSDCAPGEFVRREEENPLRDDFDTALELLLAVVNEGECPSAAWKITAEALLERHGVEVKD